MNLGFSLKSKSNNEGYWHQEFISKRNSDAFTLGKSIFDNGGSINEADGQWWVVAGFIDAMAELVRSTQKKNADISNG